MEDAPVRLCRFFEGSSLLFDEPDEELRQLRAAVERPLMVPFMEQQPREYA